MEEIFSNNVMLFFILTILILFITAVQFSLETAFNISNKRKDEAGEGEKKLFRNFPAGHFTLNNFISTIIFTRYFLFVLVITLLYPVYFSFLSQNLLISILAALLFILLIEVLPQYIAKYHPETMRNMAMPLTRLLYWLGFPLIKTLAKQTKFVNQYSQTSEVKADVIHKKNDLKELYEENRETEYTDDEDESNILDRIFRLGDVRVYEVMRPRTEIIGVELNSSVEEVLDSFIESGYSKMPVYEENLDNIKGIVSSYDLFKKPENIKAILRNVLFVPETKKCTDMLKEFSLNKVSFAIAVDEFGGTAGIVTMEDLIEELLGEIKDEFDTEEDICRKIADNAFIINGKAEIDFVNENFNTKFPKGEYSTIAGFITYFIGKIPKKGETVKLDKFRFTILKSTSTKIELVKVVIIS